MNGRIYRYAEAIATVTGPLHLVEVTASANNMTRIYDTYVGSPLATTSDLSYLSWLRKTGGGTPTFDTTATASLVGRDDPGAPDPSTVIKTNESGGTSWTLGNEEGFGYDSFDVLNGWKWEPIPGSGLVLAPAGVAVLQLLQAITSTTLTIVFTFEEIGA